MAKTSEPVSPPDPKKVLKTTSKKVKAGEQKAKKVYKENAFQKFTMVRIKRDQLKNAPYNPRIITDVARQRLKTNYETVGELAPIVWNKRTGNIVSGHQHVDILDTLNKGTNYILEVAQVDLDEKTEKEQNIFMNNPEAQGMFDLSKLEELFKTPKIDFEATGFSRGDVYNMFGDSPLEGRPEEYAALAAQIEAVSKARDEIASKSISARDDSNFFTVVVFKDEQEKFAFDKGLGVYNENVDLRFLDGRILASKLNIDLSMYKTPAEPKPATKEKKREKQKAKA